MTGPFPKDWRHVIDDTRLGLIAARKLLRRNGLVDNVNDVYWYMPQPTDEPPMHLYPACEIVDRPNGAFERAKDAFRGIFRRPSPSLQ